MGENGGVGGGTGGGKERVEKGAYRQSQTGVVCSKYFGDCHLSLINGALRSGAELGKLAGGVCVGPQNALVECWNNDYVGKVFTGQGDVSPVAGAEGEGVVSGVDQVEVSH